MKKGIEKTRYAGEYKQMVVETMQKEKLSYREAAKRFEISCGTRVAAWEQIYLEEGSIGLYIERRGRKRIERSPKPDKQMEEKLIEENKRLHAENDYLKNLQALVLEDERRRHKKGR